MAPAKQTQAKGSSRAAADSEAKDDETAEEQRSVPDASEGTTAVDAGYATHPDSEDVHDGPRTDAATKRAPVAASPLEATGQAAGDRRPPVEVQRHLSTSPVAAAAGQRSLVGAGSLGLVDEEGNDLDPDEVFDFGDGTKTYATTKIRVYQKVVQQGARTAVTQLLFPANARVPLDKAHLFVHASKAEAQSPLAEAAGRERMRGEGTKAETKADAKGDDAKD